MHGDCGLGFARRRGALNAAERSRILKTCVDTLGDTAPVVSGISALTTAEAVAQAKAAEDAGCSGLMVLPPYVYLGDWRENKAHVSAVFAATNLSCMLYNNPVAYRVDYLPAHLKELLAEHENLHAIKESSADVRRIAALRSLVGDRLAILCGVDDLIVEAIAAGATGWIAGLVNAFPEESVTLFDQAQIGGFESAFDLYSWFLPLLRMDVVPKFVQLIKLVQEEVGMGSRRVRPPRLPLVGAELAEAKATLALALSTR